MAALLMTAAVTGCNGSGELFTVSTEPPVSEVSEDESRTNEEAKGELVPKITANPSVADRWSKDMTGGAAYDDFFGAAADKRVYEAAPEFDAVTNGIEAAAPAAEAPAKPAEEVYDDWE